MTDQNLGEWTARKFHELYEKLAPKFGYLTRQETAVPWESVPEANKQLMIAVSTEVIRELQEKVSHMAEVIGLERERREKVEVELATLRSSIQVGNTGCAETPEGLGTALNGDCKSGETPSSPAQSSKEQQAIDEYGLGSGGHIKAMLDESSRTQTDNIEMRIAMAEGYASEYYEPRKERGIHVWDAARAGYLRALQDRDEQELPDGPEGWGPSAQAPTVTRGKPAPYKLDDDKEAPAAEQDTHQGRKLDVRRNEDGTVDEIVGRGEFHLEQLDSDRWYLSLGGKQFYLSSERDYSVVLLELDEDVCQPSTLRSRPDRNKDG
jgi:hypothetical protein